MGKKVNPPPVSLEFLKSHSLFGGIPEEALAKLRTMLKEEVFVRGQDIVNEGDLGDCLYFIKEGSVEVLKQDEFVKKSEPKRIAVLREGDTFGEMALIDMEPRCATVRALNDTSVLLLSNKDFSEIAHSDLRTFNMIVMNLAREISRRLRRMDAKYVDALFAGEERPPDRL